MGVFRAGVLLLVVPLTGMASEPPAAIDQATVAAACSSCHGGGHSAEARIPRLGEQTAASLERKLLGFRSGSLQGTVMNRIARGFTEAELRAMAEVLGTP